MGEAVQGHGKIWVFYDSIQKKQSAPLSTLQAQVELLSMQGSNLEAFMLWTPGWEKWEILADFLKTDQTYFVLSPAPLPPAIPQPPEIPQHRPPVFPAGKMASPNEEKTVATETVTAFVAEDSDGGADDSPYTEILEANTASGIHRTSQSDYFSNDFSAEKIDANAGNDLKIKIASAENKEAQSKRIGERHDFKLEIILINKNGRSFRSYSRNISVGGTLLETELPKEFLNAPFDLILVNKFEKDAAKGRLRFQGRVVGDYRNPRRLMFLDTDPETRTRLETLLRSYSAHQKGKNKKTTA